MIFLGAYVISVGYNLVMLHNIRTRTKEKCRLYELLYYVNKCL